MSDPRELNSSPARSKAIWIHAGVVNYSILTHFCIKSRKSLTNILVLICDQHFNRHHRKLWWSSNCGTSKNYIKAEDAWLHSVLRDLSNVRCPTVTNFTQRIRYTQCFSCEKLLRGREIHRLPKYSNACQTVVNRPSFHKKQLTTHEIIWFPI